MVRFVKKRKRKSLPGIQEGPKSSQRDLRILTFEGDTTKVDFVLNPHEITWLQLNRDMGPELFTDISSRFDIDPMFMSDAFNTEHASKVEFLDNGLFVIFKRCYFDSQGGVQSGHLAVFAFNNIIITITDKNDTPLDTLCIKLGDFQGRIKRRGADYLLFAIIDAHIEEHYICMDSLAVEIEQLEAAVIGRLKKGVIRKIHHFKMQSLYLQKVITPMKATLKKLGSRNTHFIQKENDVYFSDLYDHICQIVDSLESYRSMLADLLHVHSSMVGLRTNRVMTFLTILSTVFIPPTFIVGWYGMNFVNMPELNWEHGYAFVGMLVGLSILITGTFISRIFAKD